MPAHNFAPLSGRIEMIEISSRALSGNMLGDPGKRQVAVYLPAGYDQATQTYPLFVDLVGFTGSGFSHVNWAAFSETVPQRLERLVEEGKMGQVIMVLPDCFTSLGGNQYINSLAMGNWADFLCEEMLPVIESRYRITPGREHRAVFGKSSGGFGAIVHGLRYARHWGAIACHSGDMAFEWVYQQEFPALLRGLSAYNNSPAQFIDHLKGACKVSDTDMNLLMMLAMAATYDPSPDEPLGIQLPVTMDTCELIAERWENWLAWDPLTLVEKDECQQQLASLSGIFLDCGSLDQYGLVYGARRMHRKLDSLDIAHCYEEFEDNHSAINYRMDLSLPFLYGALTTGG